MTPGAARREWMSVLALATTEELEAAWRRVPDPPAHERLRGLRHGTVIEM